MKNEWKVLASLFALLLCMEAVVRVFETRLSKDLAHLRDLPAVAQRLKERDAYKVLIVGNSLARYSINKQMLSKSLQEKGYGKVLVEGFHPDATGVSEWYYGLRRYFLNVGAIPDQIILVTAGKHLLDRAPHPGRLGAFYVDQVEIKEVLSSDLSSVENGARFFLARLSSLFASRVRIQPFVFYNYLPEYTRTIQAINDQRKTLVGGFKSKVGDKVTNLCRLLQVSRSNDIMLSIVAVPMRLSYKIPQAVSSEVSKYDAILWDLSEIEGIDNKNFFDGYHLDADGGEKVTQVLIDRILSKK